MSAVPLCEVCGLHPAIGVACVPGLPVSAAYCTRCVQANAHPWGYLVANTAIAGGLHHTAPYWREMVENTCTHLGKTMVQFNDDVTATINDLPKE